jgi:peptidoglycan/LPS O-acetylase OafA/YrhL
LAKDVEHLPHMNPGGRYHTLDHWRGFAALWVVWFHASALWIRPDFPLTGLLHDFAKLGWTGVHIFFVISGYCVAERAARALGTGETAGAFLLDRARRIYPAYLAALILAILLAVMATPFNHRPVFDDALPGKPVQIILDAALLAPLTGHPPYLLVSWSLSCEIAFYVIVALGLALPGLHRGVVALILGFVLAVAQAAGLCDLPTFLLDLWPEFMCGILAWCTLQCGRCRFLALAGIAALGALGCIHPSPTGMLPASAAFSILLIAMKPIDQRLAGLRFITWLARLGAISYSLYLVHVPFISPAQNLLHRFMPADAPHQIWIPLALTVFALPPAWLFYRWVEKPLDQWRRSRQRRNLDSARSLHRLA